jgi:hypothetical protein
MTNVPQSLEWHGETIPLNSVVELTAADGKAYTRYEYGKSKAFFYDFGRGIDWDTEQAANKDLPPAPKKEVRPLSTIPNSVYVREWRKRKRLALALALQGAGNE